MTDATRPDNCPSSYLSVPVGRSHIQKKGKKRKDNVKNQVPSPPLHPGSPPQGERIKMIIRRRNEKCVKRRGWEAIEGGDGAKRGGIERVLGLLLPLFVCPHAMTSE